MLWGGVNDPYNGYEYVDMGDAGIWSKYPIGITEWNEDWKDNIKYFEWGGIEGYTASQVGVDKQFSSSFTEYRFSAEGATGTSNPQLTKYCSNSKYGKDGFTDNLTVLLPEDDACVVNMGGNWRMPITEEFQTLYVLCNNKLVTDYNGVTGLNGILFTLKTDESKQLFIPNGGCCVNGNLRTGDATFYSSSLDKNGSYPYRALGLFFGQLGCAPTYDINRCYGFPVVGFLGSGQ